MTPIYRILLDIYIWISFCFESKSVVQSKFEDHYDLSLTLEIQSKMFQITCDHIALLLCNSSCETDTLSLKK